MFIQTWGEVFRTSLQGLWVEFINFVPDFLIALIIFIVGWVVGVVIGKAIQQIINALKIDKLFANVGADELLAKAGLRLDVGGFLGWVTKWFIIIVFLMTSLEILGLTQVNVFLQNVVLQYLPQVVIAALILILASVISDGMKKIVIAGAKAANVASGSAKFAGSVVKWAIWVFAIIIVLSELGIAAQFMQILFTGIVAMLAIAGGLAFGLGGKEVAGKSLQNIRDQISRHDD
ncbi:hypothetical protein COB64_03455 [Candidatus Wolfebacteria bacterium]|nr:MAG: hypothetical protein COB64_03455 [Candidatus Wolfebacteria bacterium]